MKSPLVALDLLFVLPLPLERYLNGLLFSSRAALRSNHLFVMQTFAFVKQKNPRCVVFLLSMV